MKKATLLAILSFLLATPSIAMTIDSKTAVLLDFIGALEGPDGYNDYSGLAAEAPPKPLVSMTINEVLAWQDRIDQRSKSEAAGRYQIMEDTLRGLKKELRLSGDEMFDAGMQNSLAAHLAFQAGWNPNSENYVSMGNALAKVWAALPVLSGPKTGRSHYHGLAGNKALTSTSVFLAVLQNDGQKETVSEAIRLSRQTRRIRIARTVQSGPRSVRPTAFGTEIIDTAVVEEAMAGGRIKPSQVITFNVDPYQMH